MITVLDKQVPSSDGKHTLVGKVFLPEGTPRGYFHAVHGMTEYIGRYDDLLTQMAEMGYVAFGYDHLGHGKTAEEGELGYIAKRGGWKYLVEDVRVFSDAVRAEYGDLPYYLMGHSMGSFIVRLAAAGSTNPDKLIVMGTGGPNAAAGLGVQFIRMNKLVFGDHHVSPAVEKLAFGAYNERFGEEQDSRSWLSCDKERRDLYRADPFCNYHFTNSALGDLVELNRRSNKAACFRAVAEKGIPVLLVSGEDDPVGGYGAGVRKVYDLYTGAGVKAQINLYPGCRHEILGDPCREKVVFDILAFLA